MSALHNELRVIKYEMVLKAFLQQTKERKHINKIFQTLDQTLSFLKQDNQLNQT
jgi:hypothetical protein